MKKVGFFTLLIALQVLVYFVVDNNTNGIVYTINTTVVSFKAFFSDLVGYDGYYLEDITMGKFLTVSYLLLVSIPLFIAGLKNYSKNLKSKNKVLTLVETPLTVCSAVSIMIFVSIFSVMAIVNYGILAVGENFYDVKSYVEIFLLMPVYAAMVLIVYWSLKGLIDPFNKAAKITESNINYAADDVLDHKS